MNSSFKQILGVQDFQEPSKIIEFLKSHDSTQDFSNSDQKLFESNGDFKLWVITSASDIFIVRDDGFKLKILLRRKKANFEFQIIRDNRTPRLFINNTITTLPINTSLTGSTETFTETLNYVLAK